MAVLPHLDGFALPSQQHAFIGGGFPYLVGAVGQDVIAGTGAARLVRGDGHNNVAHGVSLAAHHHGVGAAVDDLELYPGKAGVALRCGAGLRILLFQIDAAPNNLVFGFVL